MTRLDRLLGYAASHPNGRKSFRASDMVLRSLSDASYLSRPRAGSVAGGHKFLGDFDDDASINHPISKQQRGEDDEETALTMVGEVLKSGGRLRSFSIGTPHADTGVREIRELISSGKAFAVLIPISLASLR